LFTNIPSNNVEDESLKTKSIFCTHKTNVVMLF